MTLSIALCTYNGESYLLEQLQSILHQVRPPDELVVFDDASTDQTVGLLRDFAARQRTFPVRIHVNPRTVGPSMNFQQAIAACQGTIISLCDQDDVWLPDKLARVETAFQDDPSLGFVFGNAEICDAECRPLGYRLWDSIGFAGRLVRRLGARLGVRRRAAAERRHRGDHGVFGPVSAAGSSDCAGMDPRCLDRAFDFGDCAGRCDQRARDVVPAASQATPRCPEAQLPPAIPHGKDDEALAVPARSRLARGSFRTACARDEGARRWRPDVCRATAGLGPAARKNPPLPQPFRNSPAGVLSRAADHDGVFDVAVPAVFPRMEERRPGHFSLEPSMA